jgi:hypothetical protein
MIISPKYLIITTMIFTDINLHTNKTTQSYIPYTMTSMMENKNDQFLNEFWKNILKEECEKQQWNPEQY